MTAMTARHRRLSPENRPLLPAVRAGGRGTAVITDHATLTYADLRATGAAVAQGIAEARRVAVWCEPGVATCIAVVGALLAGVEIVPINPKAGPRELEHVVEDSRPEVVLCDCTVHLPAALGTVPRLDVDLAGRAEDVAPEPSEEACALIMYTSGTTGLPKGVMLSRHALAANLDALTDAWDWTSADVVVHALPLFHVHGLVIGVLGALRLGGTVRLIRRFSAAAVVSALASGGTMFFGVPTMYRRLGAALRETPAYAGAVASARLLVSGSAALSKADHAVIASLTGQRVVERYGMTETLIISATRASGDRQHGSVGPPLNGVSVRLVDEVGRDIPRTNSHDAGEVWVRTPALFEAYLNQPEATATATRDGWFRTGDVASWGNNGALRLLGRSSTDVIKTGGFKVGAAEIEDVLRVHPDIADAAVTGEADGDLGERIVAWVVPSEGRQPSERDLIDYVASELSPHKRPRAIYYISTLPRNHLGKVLKRDLGKT
jgi:malonyl-CoA/methylmalonyl-CoA synthetase